MEIKKRKRGDSGYTPTKEEVRKLRGDRTQEAMAGLIYTSARVWRKYESGELRMHPFVWEHLTIKKYRADKHEKKIPVVKIPQDYKDA